MYIHFLIFSLLITINTLFFISNVLIKKIKISPVNLTAFLGDIPAVETCKNFLNCRYSFKEHKIVCLEFPENLSNLLSLTIFIHEYAHSLDCKTHRKSYVNLNKYVAVFFTATYLIQITVLIAEALIYIIKKEFLDFTLIKIFVGLLEGVYLFVFIISQIRVLFPEFRTFGLSVRLIRNIDIRQKTKITAINLLNLTNKILEVIIWGYSILIIIMLLYF